MATFIKSALKPEDWIRDNKIEFCFMGRSNVGKSTLINALAHKEVARTSKTPGRTRLVNFFDFGGFRLIDLPGYGFAKVSGATQKDINFILESYLTKRENLMAVFQIVDASVVTPSDASMSEYLNNNFRNHYVILNKIDKINERQLPNQLPKIAAYLNVERNRLITISAKKSQNVKQILNIMGELKKIK